jgi:hypothetical protein
MGEKENLPMTTLPLLVQEEARLFETAYQRLGEPFPMAQESTLLLSTFMASVSADREVFVRCMSILKKQHTLALLSVVRRHHIQAFMNLRQVVEGASNAAYALAHPAADYIDGDTGLVMDAKALSDRTYKWIEEQFPAHSADLKDVKTLLNEQGTHFHIVNSERLFGTDVEAGQWNTDFFDKEDIHLITSDLWLVTQTAIATMHLLDQVRLRFGGFVPADNFYERANVLYAHSQEVVAQMTATERHQKASRAAAEADARKAAAKQARRQAHGGTKRAAD